MEAHRLAWALLDLDAEAIDAYTCGGDGKRAALRLLKSLPCESLAGLTVDETRQTVDFSILMSKGRPQRFTLDFGMAGLLRVRLVPRTEREDAARTLLSLAEWHAEDTRLASIRT